MNDPDRPRQYRTSRYDRGDSGRYSEDERDDYDDRRGYRRDPRDMVQGPGWALAIVGWSGLVLTAFGLAVAALMAVNDPNLPAQDFYIGAAVYGGLGLIGIAMFAIIAVGGQSMRKCRHYGLCMTAAILLIATVVILGLCGVVTVPFGVWALVVLGDHGVKRQFERVRGPRMREVDGGWEGRQ